MSIDFNQSLLEKNPVTIENLGICSALAVTLQIKTAFIMALAMILVLIFSSIFVSILRKIIPQDFRLVVQLVIIASLVMFADMLIAAYLPQISSTISVFVGLIITNCIILGRTESFAMNNSVKDSFLDSLSNAFGYALVLILVATVREILGSGTFLEKELFSSTWFSPNLLLLSPAGAFILFGLLIWLQKTLMSEK